MALQRTPLLNEAVSNLVIQQLKDNYNVFLQELDNQYSDGINLEPVEDNAIYISDKVQSLTLPAIYCLFGRAAFQYTDKPNYMQSEDQALIVVSAEDIGAEELTKKIWRMGRVLYECLNLASLKSGDGRVQINLIPVALDYTAPVVSKLKKEEQKFRMDAVLELKIMHFENFLTD